MPQDPRLSALDKISDWWSLNDLYDPAHGFTMTATFMEAHCILGGLKRMDFLGSSHASREVQMVSDRTAETRQIQDALVRQDLSSGSGPVPESIRILAGVAAYNDRVVSTQGVQGYPEALLMRYGLERKNGQIKHSCVADQASVANAALEVLAALPDHPHRAGWLECLTAWADWVLREFPGPDGGMGVGVLAYEWNPMEVYWCATSLFSASLFRLHLLTGKEAYRKQAMESLDWLARFSFSDAVIPDFQTSPGGVMLYFTEGLAEGLSYLHRTEGIDAARNHPAAEKARECLQWLVENQQETGTLPIPTTRGHRPYELGIPWTALRINAILKAGLEVDSFVDRFLTYMVTEAGMRYYGILNRPWGTGLAQLSLGEWAIRSR